MICVMPCMSLRNAFCAAFLWLAGTTCFFSCSHTYPGQARDESLVKTYCQSCHLLPEPGLLTKATWKKYVLPKMGNLLGIPSNMYGEEPAEKNEFNAFMFPSKPVLSKEEWAAIVRYYLTLSPDSLTKAAKPARIDTSLACFQARFPAFALADPRTCLVKTDALTSSIYFGDGIRANLYRTDWQLHNLDSLRCGIAPVQFDRQAEGFTLLTMGIFSPSDTPAGSLRQFKNFTEKAVPVLEALARPTHVITADLNADKQPDLLVCEFGFYTGSLSWFENKGKAGYEKHVLQQVCGAIRAAVRDFNNDGLPDILALMAQGNEGFDLYLNQGNGTFSAPERLLRFPPSFGSNYFELADFNKDGFPDILATNGDNGDYPLLLKPYHGIRIYLNDGKNHFSEKYFYPQNGAGKAIVADFDLDGDPDIASISFFPDFKNTPEESFIYLENQGDFAFKASTFPEATQGRWMVMDAGDPDKDGDTDLVLGSCTMPFFGTPEKYIKTWQQNKLPLLILENRTRMPIKNSVESTAINKKSP